MIKFANKLDDGGLSLGFGLSERNIELLKAGKPIKIDLKEMVGIEGSAIIFYGKTEKEMLRALKPYIGPETKTNLMDEGHPQESTNG